MTMTIRRILLSGGLAAALAGSAAVAGCGNDHDGHEAEVSKTTTPATGAAEAASSPSADSAAVDAAFVRQMIPHHEMAVEMATAVAGSVAHPEIKELADDVIAAQSKEIKTLAAKAKALDIDTEGATAKLEADAKTLGLAPDQLGMEAHLMHGGDISERAFIDGMIPHHEGAIAMANAQLAAGEDADLKALSEDIVAAQQAEIEQLIAWRDEWYGGEPVDGAPATSHAHGGEHE